MNDDDFLSPEKGTHEVDSDDGDEVLDPDLFEDEEGLKELDFENS